eukprot:1161843-Pelagomonas_calceolata.AAC.8
MKQPQQIHTLAMVVLSSKLAVNSTSAQQVKQPLRFSHASGNFSGFKPPAFKGLVVSMSKPCN